MGAVRNGVELSVAEQLMICRLYRDGATLREIGRRLRVSQGAIYHALKRHRVPVRRKQLDLIKRIHKQMVAAE